MQPEVTITWEGPSRTSVPKATIELQSLPVGIAEGQTAQAVDTPSVALNSSHTMPTAPNTFAGMGTLAGAAATQVSTALSLKGLLKKYIKPDMPTGTVLYETSLRLEDFLNEAAHSILAIHAKRNYSKWIRVYGSGTTLQQGTLGIATVYGPPENGTRYTMQELQRYDWRTLALNEPFSEPILLTDARDSNFVRTDEYDNTEAGQYPKVIFVVDNPLAVSTGQQETSVTLTFDDCIDQGCQIAQYRPAGRGKPLATELTFKHMVQAMGLPVYIVTHGDGFLRKMSTPLSSQGLYGADVWEVPESNHGLTTFNDPTESQGPKHVVSAIASHNNFLIDANVTTTSFHNFRRCSYGTNNPDNVWTIIDNIHHLTFRNYESVSKLKDRVGIALQDLTSDQKCRYSQMVEDGYLHEAYLNTGIENMPYPPHYHAVEIDVQGVVEGKATEMIRSTAWYPRPPAYTTSFVPGVLAVADGTYETAPAGLIGIEIKQVLRTYAAGQPLSDIPSTDRKCYQYAESLDGDYSFQLIDPDTNRTVYALCWIKEKQSFFIANTHPKNSFSSDIQHLVIRNITPGISGVYVKTVGTWNSPVSNRRTVLKSRATPQMMSALIGLAQAKVQGRVAAQLSRQNAAQTLNRDSILQGYTQSNMFAQNQLQQELAKLNGNIGTQGRSQTFGHNQQLSTQNYHQQSLLSEQRFDQELALRGIAQRQRGLGTNRSAYSNLIGQSPPSYEKTMQYESNLKQGMINSINDHVPEEKQADPSLLQIQVDEHGEASV